MQLLTLLKDNMIRLNFAAQYVLRLKSFLPEEVLASAAEGVVWSPVCSLQAGRVGFSPSIFECSSPRLQQEHPPCVQGRNYVLIKMLFVRL